jgi:hypothetical protein
LNRIIMVVTNKLPAFCSTGIFSRSCMIVITVMMTLKNSFRGMEREFFFLLNIAERHYS